MRKSAVVESIGAYQILEKVGDGGMAVVYRCRHRTAAKAAEQGGDVAVKVMHPHLAQDEGFQARFEREARIGLELDHPGIVRVHDLVVDQGRLGLVLEWIDGEPLDARLARGPMPVEEALECFEAIARAVGYAHEKTVVHRDIKPQNILLSPQGPKVVDFGIAKSAQQATLTRTGAGIGTPWYMAPEQYVEAKGVDGRADIYALGMVFAEMLTGALPWPPELSEYEVLRRKADGELTLDAVPERFHSVLQRCLEPDPENRWATTGVLIAALHSADGPPTKTPEKAAPRKERVKRKSGGSGALAGCGGLFALGCLGTAVAVPVGLVVLALLMPDSSPGSWSRDWEDNDNADDDWDGLADQTVDPCPNDGLNVCYSANAMYQRIGAAGLWQGATWQEGVGDIEVFIRINAGGGRGAKVGDIDYVWGGRSCGGNLVRGWESFAGLHFTETMVRGYGCDEGDITLKYNGFSIDFTWTDGFTTLSSSLYRIEEDVY